MQDNCVSTAVAAAVAIILLAGCEASCPKTGSTADATTCTELAFPTGDRSTSAIVVRQRGPREPIAGKECAYAIEVTNLTDGTLRNVKINLEDLSNVQFVSSDPQPMHGTNGDMSWVLADIPAHATRTISMRARAVATGTTSNCLSASYANTLCTTAIAVAPSLDITKSSTPEACGQCEDIRLTYVVRNPGTGTATGVTVRDDLPEGLRTTDGRSTVSFDAGDLPAGGQQTFTTSVRASKSGRFVSAASASAESGLSAKSADVATVVRQPSLAFSCDANNRVFLGRDLAYRITVRNTGQCDATGAAIKAVVPDGCRLVSAESQGKVDGRTVTWSLERLAPGKSSTVVMNLRPSGVGDAKVAASAWADCVPVTTTECSTEVVGIPAILLEVIDTVDPVEVGTETSFNVTVTNQGSSGDSNVRLVGTLPESLQFVSGTGATAVTCSGQAVTIAPLASLAPGARAEWRISVKARYAADARSRWEMTSDQFKVPVVETESTNLYR